MRYGNVDMLKRNMERLESYRAWMEEIKALEEYDKRWTEHCAKFGLEPFGPHPSTDDIETALKSMVGSGEIPRIKFH